MLIVDEYLAVRVLVGAWPDELPQDEPLALPAYRHYRLLQRIHQPGVTGCQVTEFTFVH